jgi:hypothetical protein
VEEPVEERLEEQVVAATPLAIVDSTSFNEADEVLSFIAELTDGTSTTVFRSNDVFVKNES